MATSRSGGRAPWRLHAQALRLWPGLPDLMLCHHREGAAQETGRGVTQSRHEPPLPPPWHGRSARAMPAAPAAPRTAGRKAHSCLTHSLAVGPAQALKAHRCHLDHSQDHQKQSWPAAAGGVAAEPPLHAGGTSAQACAAAPGGVGHFDAAWHPGPWPARAHAPQLRCPMQTLLRMGGRRVPSAAAHPAAAAPAAVAMPACAAAVESCVS